MEDSKSLDHLDEIPDKKINNETLEINKKESGSIPNNNNKLNQNKNLNINAAENGNNKLDNEIVADNIKVDLTSKLDAKIDKNNNAEISNNQIISEEKFEDNKLNTSEAISETVTNKSVEKVDKAINLEVNKKTELTSESNDNIYKSNKNEISDSKIIKEKLLEDNKLAASEVISDKVTNKSAEKVDQVNQEINLEESKKIGLKPKINTNLEKNNAIEASKTIPVKAKTKPVKAPPIEKKPFLEFVNDYLIPEIKNEFKLKGKEVNKINLQKTNRPIAEDICWVIYCEINDTCNFWLSFERDDITSLKSFSLCKNYEKPSIIESFLIDEKKITLKLIISRILQRLNGQKLIGAN